MNISTIYAMLPLTERALLKRYASYPFKLANDGPGLCDWYLYDKNDKPVAVILYRGGRKLCLHGIE